MARTFERAHPIADKSYIYQEAGGSHVSFYPHPKEAFVFVQTDGDKSIFEDVITAFIKQGFRQHDYAGGWDEAIQTLVIA